MKCLKGEKKPDPKAAALPFYKRFTRKQVFILEMITMAKMMMTMMMNIEQGHDDDDEDEDDHDYDDDIVGYQQTLYNTFRKR